MLKPTESELEILQFLWEFGPMTVRELNDQLNKHRRVGYTTSLKMMQIMTEKGLLTRDTAQRSHVYAPALLPDDVQSNMLDHVLKTVFRGDRSKLVLQALGNHEVTPEELSELKAIINKMEEEQNGTV
jgi:BlaI family transcriptional regulator, penicillinase repressor